MCGGVGYGTRCTGYRNEEQSPSSQASARSRASAEIEEEGGLMYFEAVLPAEDRLAATRVVRDLGALPPGLESVGNDGSGSEYPANLKPLFRGGAEVYRTSERGRPPRSTPQNRPYVDGSKPA